MIEDNWRQKFDEAMRWVEETIGKEYTAGQTKNYAQLLRNSIPPLRLMKVFQYAVKNHKFSTLPTPNEFLQAQAECPLSDMTLEKHEAVCDKCSEGWIYYKVQGLNNIMHSAYGLCKCWKGMRMHNAFSKAGMVFFEDIPIMAELLQAGLIEFKGGHPIDAETESALWMQETEHGLRIMTEDEQTEIVGESLNVLHREGGLFAKTAKMLADKCGLKEVAI